MTSLQDIKLAKDGFIKIKLSPNKLMPNSWLFPNRDALILVDHIKAPLLAAYGYEVMVTSNEFVNTCNKYGLKLKIVTKRNLPNNRLAMIITNDCDWNESYRLLKNGGILISRFQDSLELAKLIDAGFLIAGYYEDLEFIIVKAIK